jgi:hypothetical protein
VKPGDLVRYKKRYEWRSEFQSDGVLTGLLIRDVTQEYGSDNNRNDEMFEVLFGEESVVMYKYEIELVTE